jgi:hypothetical protein
MKTPTLSEKARLVRLLAGYILTDGAHIKRQEVAYGKYMAYFEALEVRYPHVNFRDADTQASLIAAAKRAASRKVFRGAGATF